MRIRILLADDLQLRRLGLHIVLESQADLEVVATVSSGLEAAVAARRCYPDVAILTAILNELNGFDTAARILRISPKTKPLLIGLFNGDYHVRRSARAGAWGYLLPTTTSDELIQAVRVLKRGATFASRPVKDLFEASRSARENVSHSYDSFERLTATQRLIYQLLAEGNCNESIANRLGMSPYTVETHRFRVMEKLELRNIAELILDAFRRGILM